MSAVNNVTRIEIRYTDKSDKVGRLARRGYSAVLKHVVLVLRIVGLCYAHMGYP